MIFRHTLAAMSLVALTASPALADTFLIHIHAGPDNPTEAALGFLVAMTAQKDGHKLRVHSRKGYYAALATPAAEHD